SSVDLPHHVIFRNGIAKMKLVKQLTLVTLQTAHHGSTSPRIASTQRNHASRPASTDSCHKICQQRKSTPAVFASGPLAYSGRPAARKASSSLERNSALR